MKTYEELQKEWNESTYGNEFAHYVYYTNKETIERLEKEKEELKEKSDRVSNLENRLLSANSDIQSRNKKIEKLNNKIQRFNPSKLYEEFREEFKHSDYSRMTPLDFVEWMEDRLTPDN